MPLYIIRHGDPHYPTDSLTERGVLQAEAVGKRLAAAGIDKVFSSPMGRAKQTAEPTCRLLGLECNIEPWASCRTPTCWKTAAMTIISAMPASSRC